MDSLQSVRAWVYVSMSDKVVSRLMRRRGSRGLGWLQQPPPVVSLWHLWSGGDHWLCV